MNYWLFKSEPGVFSIDDLQTCKATIWDGIRNYQARNYLRTVEVGDLAFFYHSSNEDTGIVGLCRVIEANVADPTQFDAKSDYFDPKSTLDAPRWQTVKVEFVEKFPRLLTLEELKEKFTPEELIVVRKGMRLSVMPVSEEAAQRLLAMVR